jgi:hypothetical protein
VRKGGGAMKPRLLVGLVGILGILGCGCVSPRGFQLSENEIIAIAKKEIEKDSNWKYSSVSVSRTKSGGWLVFFDGQPDVVGDYVFVHLDSKGNVVRKD